MTDRSVRLTGTPTPQPGTGILRPFPSQQVARVEHRDSLGNQRTVESGGMQWLVAGAGALHEEILNGDDDGVFHMAQLWVNLPAAPKMTTPEHHAIDASDIPVFDHIGIGTRIRLFAGSLGGHTGPAPLGTPVVVAHVTIRPGGTVTLPITVSSADGGEILLMAGEPIGEPIAMGGGIVMNTREEIQQAFADEAAGRMGQLEPTQ